MTDKELIKQEIERLKEHTAKCGYPGQGEFENGNREGRNYVCDKLLSFIDSLPEEPESDDLEEAADQYALRDSQAYKGVHCTYVDDKIAFKAGAEWQKRKDQETIELAEDHAMLAGMNKMKEEMMKMAEDTAGLSLSWGEDSKTKIIIIEEEQQ